SDRKDYSSESHPTKPLDEVRTSGVISPPSPFSLIDRPRAGHSHAATQTTFSLSSDSHCPNDGNSTRLSEELREASWKELPWPALSRLLFHLRTNEDCSALANLAQIRPQRSSRIHDEGRKSSRR
ncbi:hypothetical protein PMAYCL1PPCAC_26980, partial [Pristionchus mayeri]